MKSIFKISALALLLCLPFAFQFCSKKTAASVSVSDKPHPGVRQPIPDRANPAPPPPPPPLPESKPDFLATPIPSDPDVRIGELPNGMKYYIRKNNKPENRAELRLAVNVGATAEDEDQRGLAHFVEHMCFNGTKNFKKQELVDYLESTGMRFGPDLNAYTSFDETVYMLQVRTDDAVIWGKAMQVIEDWSNAVTFDGSEIDKERGVVESEWRSGLGPDERMQDKTFPILFKGSRYAERLPIGKPEIIRNASHETFRRFYRDWYRPDLMAVCVVGNVDMDATERDIKARFGRLPNPSAERRIQSWPVPPHKETLVAMATDKEAAFTDVGIMYKHPALESHTIGDFRASIVRGLYNSMLNARLDEITKGPNPPFLGAFSSYFNFVRTMDAYSSSAGVPENGALRGLEILLDENERVLRHGFHTSEMERVKKSFLVSAERAVKEKDKTESSNWIGRYVNHFLENNPMPSPEQTLDLYKNLLPTIRVEEVNELAKKWITPENRVVTITGPEKAGSPLPSEAEVLALLEKAKGKNIAPYVDNVVNEPLLKTIPTPAAITSEKSIAEIGVTELTFGNGVRVVLKPTDFKNDEIVLQAFSPGGSSLYSDADYLNADYADVIVNNSGVGPFNPTALRKFMTGKVARISPFIGELNEGLNGGCRPDDLETMLQLLYSVVTSPRKDNDAFQSFLSKEMSELQNLNSDPDFYFSDQIRRIQSNNHPRRKQVTSEELGKINHERAMEIFRDRFGDMGDFTFVLVGSFSVEKIKPLLQTYLGNLPSKKRVENWRDVQANFPAGKVEKQLVKGQEPKTFVNLTWHGELDWDIAQDRYDFRSMVDVLRIKLRESLREDKGGVYGVGIFGGPRRWPKEEFSTTVSFNCDPPRREELIAAAMEVIKSCQLNGVEEKDINKVKEIQRQDAIKNLKVNGFWAGQLNSYYQNQLDPRDLLLEKQESLINGLTSEAVKKMAGRVFLDGGLIKVVMVPENR